MIKAILIINNYGKPRLVKFYQSVTSEDAQQSVIRRVFQQVLIFILLLSISLLYLLLLLSLNNTNIINIIKGCTTS